MNSGTLHIIKLWAWLGISSILYFCTLLLHIPILVTTILSFTLGLAIFYQKQHTGEKHSLLAVIIAAIGVYLLINEATNLAEKHGLWDAWAIWNLHGAYLASPINWQQLFNNSNGAHPDYPLALPSLLAYLRYIVPHSYYWLASYGLHLLITLSIPIALFTESYKKNFIIATIGLLLLCTNTHFIYIGVSQLADILLSLFFLLAIISLNNAKQHPKLILLAALFTGLCVWTKNEGIVLACFIVLFHFRQFFSKKSLKPSILGLTMPILSLLLFKYLCATPNDLLSTERQPIWELITTASRYEMIYDSFVGNLNLHFKSIQYASILFALLAILRWKKLQLRQLIMIIVICLAMMSVYLISPHDLEWHLATSQNRLILQLLPAFVYVLTINFAELATLDLPKGLLLKTEPPQ